ncbi:hypothetical protein ACH8I4_17050 [Acinetobacter sp. ABJ_C3_5]|uniref:hypothetical protein n=1 Tax=Acinetobacter courvalinii TaxID=280147 RepID=UPI0037C89667
MREFFFSTRLYKQLPSTESDIQKQLEILEKVITKISEIDPIFMTWYINNSTSSIPPLDYIFPSKPAFNYFFDQRKKDVYKSFLLWNGQEKANFASFNLDTVNISMTFYKELSCNQLIRIFEEILEFFKFQYIYFNSDFFADINVFPHRLETTSICYVPKKIENGDIPHLYKKIDVNNELNQGTILIFDQNLFDESDEMKKKVQENSVALVDMGLIPEAELDADFFSGV